LRRPCADGAGDADREPALKVAGGAEGDQSFPANIESSWIRVASKHVDIEINGAIGSEIPFLGTELLPSNDTCHMSLHLPYILLGQQADRIS